MLILIYSLTGLEFVPLPSIYVVDGYLYPNMPKPKEHSASSSGDFSFFSRLPTEVRQLIWQLALPGPRILTRSGDHNKQLTLLRVCRESRDVVKSRYVRLLRSASGFDLEAPVPALALYANVSIDIVVIDLTLPQTEDSGPEILDRSPFDLPPEDFRATVFKCLIGLSRVKHLALAFNVAEENGGALFPALQACCPNLQTLTVFPNSQMHASTRDQEKSWGKHDLHFLEVDSNLTDFEYFRHDLLPSRRFKEKSFRGLEILHHLEDIGYQYATAFPEHVEKCCLKFNSDWNPTARLCLLTSWNERCNGYQTLHLEGDEYWKGYPGEDGRLCEGFIESGMVCNADGEVYSRYDGIKRLFDEDYE
jgi:2EXR family